MRTVADVLRSLADDIEDRRDLRGYAVLIMDGSVRCEFGATATDSNPRALEIGLAVAVEQWMRFEAPETGATETLREQ